MKNFKFNYIFFLSAIILLAGCMPNSLTKFTKDPPKVVVKPTETVPTVTNGSGTALTFVAPSVFYYNDSISQTVNATVGKSISVKPVIDGSLGSTSESAFFLDSCAIVGGGNPQTQQLPSDLILDPKTCIISGTPVSISSVGSPITGHNVDSNGNQTGVGVFCSDDKWSKTASRYQFPEDTITPDPTMQHPSTHASNDCATRPFEWTPGAVAETGTCSNPDFQYSASKSACEAGKNKWYEIGSPIPYRIAINYHDEFFNKKTIYTTVHIGKYKAPSNLQLSQSDKLLLTVSGTGLADIVPYTEPTIHDATVKYDPTNIIIGESGAGGVAKYIDTTLNKVGVNRLVKIVPASISGFDQSSQYKYIVTPVTNMKYKLGKIVSVDTTALYIENLTANNVSFKAGDYICTNTNGTDACTTGIEVKSVDSNYTFTDTNLDNNTQYYSAKFTMGNQVNVYEKDPEPILDTTAYTIKDITVLQTNDSLSDKNAVTYKISPALPAGLAFSSTTGAISGHFKTELAPTKFTVTATNVLGSTSGSIYLSSMTAPTDFNLTNKQIITVSGNALFIEGEELFQPITPPMAESRRAKILKKYGEHKLAIETYNGEFLAGKSLDSGSAYISQKAFIIPDGSCVDTSKTNATDCLVDKWSAGPIYYNVSFNVDNLTDFDVGHYITTALGAKAIIKARDSLTLAPADRMNTLFVQMLTQTATGVSTALSFNEGNSIQETTSNTFTNITQVQNSNMKITLADATGFIAGSDITTSDITNSPFTGAYTSDVTASILSLSDITTKPSGIFLTTGQSIYQDEFYSGPTTTITAVTYDNLYLMERGKLTSIHGNLLAGSGVTYSISPALPSGLVFDTANGSISGTPLVAQVRQDFVITAKNFMGESKFVTALEVRDYFQIADKSDTSSFILHKVGDTQINRKCRVNADDLLRGNSKALDIRCFLDGQEEDIYLKKIKFNALSGPGVCEYVQYAPYYFQQYSALQTTIAGTSSKYPVVLTVNTGCGNETPPSNDKCESNYTASGGPNCDEGALKYNEVVMSANPTTGVCNISAAPVPKTVSCGGKAQNCFAGPITDVLSLDQIGKGLRSIISNSYNGLDYTWTLSAPGDTFDFTNLRVANGTIKNRCSMATDSGDVVAWKTAMATVNGTISPLGMNGLKPSRPSSNPYYEFNCLNAAKEIKARIRVIVRDWDKAFKIDSGIDNYNAVFTTQPASMNLYGTGGPLGLYNNYTDWDDTYAYNKSGSLLGAASYNGGACGVHASHINTCSDGVSLTKATCLAVPAVWTGCSNATSLTQAACLAILAVWTTSCSDGVTTNQFECVLNGNTWSGDEEYKFPMSDL